MSEKELRVAGFANDSIVDGPGIRYAIFTQGCHHDCTGCHNPETHDVGGGFVVTTEELWAPIAKNPLLDGVTLSGGEPLLQPEPLLDMARRCHGKGLDVWLYTGFLFEQVLAGVLGAAARELITEVDVVVDGPFIEGGRSLELAWRGSSNQRIIDVPASLEAGHVVELA
ncbi:MAG: anaerobic ribonucleoside-triphosphate reductase activating protein [Actinobacteria bacterium]|nr:anaerobic ribonucleoside-triphosphate reductase activating protein [Actinomycetota bacterium]